MIIVAKKHCPAGYVLFADMCYVVGEGELSWNDARAWCKHNDSRSDLVSIHSPLENDQVSDSDHHISMYDDDIDNDVRCGE